MTLPEIGPDPARQRRADFGRRGPWGAPLCAVWNHNNNEAGRYRRSNTPMGRWPGEFYELMSSLLHSLISLLVQSLFSLLVC